MTDVNDTQPDMTEIDAFDHSELAQHYAEPASTSGASKPALAPGVYALRVPSNLPDDAFKVNITAAGKRYLTIRLDNGLTGDAAETLTITDGPAAGTPVRYQRVNTLVVDATRWNNDLRVFEPILGADGVVQKFCTALDLLRAAGSTATPSSRDEWIEAIRAIGGATVKAYLELQGNARGNKNPKGFNKTIYNSAFKKADGSYAKFIEMVATDAFTRKQNGKDVTVSPGETYPVFAQLTLGRRAFSTRG